MGDRSGVARVKRVARFDAEGAAYAGLELCKVVGTKELETRYLVCYRIIEGTDFFCIARQGGFVNSSANYEH